MKTMEEIAKSESITEDLDRKYDLLIEELQKAKEEKRPIDEGLFSAILGGAAAAGFGPAVMRAVCKALGIDERGALGNLMTSRFVLGAVGATIGWRY